MWVWGVGYTSVDICKNSSNCLAKNYLSCLLDHHDLLWMGQKTVVQGKEPWVSGVRGQLMGSWL